MPARIAATALSITAPPLDDPVAAGQVRVDAHLVVAERLEQRRRLGGARVADLEHERGRPAAAPRRRARRSSSCAAADERKPRLPVADLRLNASISSGSRRRVRDDEVERPPPAADEVALRRGRRVGARRAPRSRAASASASAETSIAVTRAPGCSSAIASAIAPEPVPTSSTRGRSTPSRSARQRSTTTSVSGRGTSARAVDVFSVSRRKPHSPRMYASGSRVAAPARRARGTRRARRRRAAGRAACRARPARARAPSRAGAPRRGAASSTPAARGTRSPPASASPTVTRRALERPSPILGGERLGELVELALEDRGPACAASA